MKSRMLFVFLWFVMLVAVPSAGAASPNIAVSDGGWGTANPREIRAIALSAAGEIARHCPRTRVSSIVVYHREDHPQTDWERTADGRVAVGLAVRDRQCAQIAFQFAHEFCHVLAMHSNGRQGASRGEGRPNLWLEESLAETASLFALRAMARSWERSAPFREWRSYAPEFSAYAAERMRSAEAEARGNFLGWFQRNEPSMRRNPELRDRNAVVALKLLPIFEAEPRAWEAVTFMNLGTQDRRQPLAAFLAEWRRNCPASLQPVVMRIAGVFGIVIQG
jgi:hypothetical protein